jgi:hypothetical protein
MLEITDGVMPVVVKPLGIPDDTPLTRRQLAEALTARGYPTSVTLLDDKACRGGGPPFRKYGRSAIYRWGDALAWAQSRMSKEVNTTRELRAIGEQ